MRASNFFFNRCGQIVLAGALAAGLALTMSGCKADLPHRNTWVAPSQPAAADPVPSLSEQAIEVCQRAVVRQLKAPATAQFPAPPGDGSVTATPNDPNNPDAGPWAITGSVDAQNSFGALIRTVYFCAARVEGDQMIAEATLLE